MAGFMFMIYICENPHYKIVKWHRKIVFYCGESICPLDHNEQKQSLVIFIIKKINYMKRYNNIFVIFSLSHINNFITHFFLSLFIIKNCINIIRLNWQKIFLNDI